MALELPALLPGATELTAFRYSSYDVPFWNRPNTRDGRWNFAGDGATQYWSLTPEGAWADLIRQERLVTEAELELVRMPFWVCRIATGLLVDFRQLVAREEHGIELDELTADDWRACQQLSIPLRSRYVGVIAPGAALADHANITLFGRRRAIDWDSRPALASAIPASRAAIGRPPQGLVDRVLRPTEPPGDQTLF